MHGLGLTVEIQDEGDFWLGRRLDLLRKDLDEMNDLVAAAAGALKDASQEGQSPIFAHQHFERLEAEGAVRVAPGLEQLRAAIGIR